MRFSDIVKMCFESLGRRKGRTILTVLGVFIGCTSIIVMVSIGAGMRESQDKMVANMGDVTIIQVYSNGESKLNDDAVNSFRAISNVRSVMPKASLEGYEVQMSAGANDRYHADWANLIGVDATALEDAGYELLTGDYPGKGEVVVGQYFAYNFRDTIMPDGKNYVDRWIWDEESQSYSTENTPDPFFNPITTSVVLELRAYDAIEGSEPYRHEVTVSGITKEDYGRGWETSEGMMMDIEDMRELLKTLSGNNSNTKFEYSEIYVKVDSIDYVEEVEQEIKDLGYHTFSMQSIREELAKQARQIELMLGGLGAISLLVAAIGITNTMTMSVSERTKEIGIMKAIGCYVKDIRLLFLMEAGSIGLLGGILGLAFSFIVSVVINLFSFGAFSDGQLTMERVLQAVFGGEEIARISVITPELIVFAILFSLLVGLLSGYHPANKAVKISALEAIRNE